MIHRSPRLAAALVAAAILAAGAGSAEAAKDPACKPTKWTLNLPSGMDQGEAVIAETPENHVWRVGVGGVPADAMLIIEYKSTVGTKGEVVLNPGAAELVDGATITMRLKRGGATSQKAIAVAGTYNIKCGK